MNFKSCIKVKRKVTLNVEKALNTVFSRYGYHVVRNPEHYERNLLLLENESKWWTLVSSEIDELDLAQLQVLASEISAIFKTITYIEPFEMPVVTNLHEFHFSSVHDAFEEPPFLKEGPTTLKWFMTAADCRSDRPFTLSFINTGGVSKGLELYITGNFTGKDTVAFEPLRIHSREYKKRDSKLLTFESEQKKIRLKDGEYAYFYDFPEFEFPEGINQYSAVLGFKMDCIFRRSVNFWTQPTGSEHELETMNIYFLPKTNRGCGIEWHRRDSGAGIGNLLDSFSDSIN